MRRALHELTHIGHSRKRILDDALIRVRQSGLARKLLDVIAVGLAGRNTSGRGVRLVQEPRIRQIRHYVADGCRTETLFTGPRQGPRSHRFARGDKRFHDRREDLALALSHLSSRWHIAFCDLAPGTRPKTLKCFL